MLRCNDGSLYTGCTNQVAHRLTVHQSGKGAKYTRSRLPVELVYQETVADRSSALRREAEIKRLTRQEKLQLIKGKGSGGMTEIRRKDKAMDEAFAWEAIDQCTFAVLSMTAEDGNPYGVPLTIVRSGRDIYFHSAMAGRKVESLRQHPAVCLTCVSHAQTIQERFTVSYASAMAFGAITEVTQEKEKLEALRLLCLRHTPDGMEGFDKEASMKLSHTAIWKLAVREISGKKGK